MIQGRLENNDRDNDDQIATGHLPVENSFMCVLGWRVLKFWQWVRGHVAEHMILADFQVVNGENTQGELWQIYKAQVTYQCVNKIRDQMTGSNSQDKKLTKGFWSGDHIHMLLIACLFLLTP